MIEDMFGLFVKQSLPKFIMAHKANSYHLNLRTLPVSVPKIDNFITFSPAKLNQFFVRSQIKQHLHIIFFRTTFKILTLSNPVSAKFWYPFVEEINYEYLQKTGLACLEIKEVTVSVLLSMITSPTTERIISRKYEYTCQIYD